MLRVISITVALALAASIAWAASSAPFWESFARISGEPWGVVTLVDLYGGFALFACVIATAERSAPRALAWFAAMCVTGNLAAAAWLGLRGIRLLPALSRPSGA